MITKRQACEIGERVLEAHHDGAPDLVARFIIALDKAGAFVPAPVTTRPYGLTPADLAGLESAIAEVCLAFVTAYCERMGWPTNPRALDERSALRDHFPPGVP